MTTETDMATIQAATDKLVGPLRVWVLEIEGGGGYPGVHAHYTLKGAIDKAEFDMMESFPYPRQAEWEAAVSTLASNHCVEYRGVGYSVKLVQVMP